MKIEKIIIHCSASGWGTAEIIDEWHAKRGFQRRDAFAKDSHLKHIGYHYLIENGEGNPTDPYDRNRDGMVVPCRNEKEPGAHAWGLNGRSLGVCLIGRDSFTEAQMRSLHGVCQGLLTKHGLGPVDIIGHYQTPHEQSKDKPKTCPNFDVSEWKGKITWVF